MRNLPAAACFAVAAMFSACSAPDAPADETPADGTIEAEVAIEPLSEQLETQIVDYLAQYGRNWPSFGFHGVVLVARGDDVAVHRAFGLADLWSGVDNETTTRFRIGTMSAQLTAAAVMLLAQRGQLSLSDTVEKHLPDYPRGSAITIEQLLTHTSGIPNFTESGWFDRVKHRRVPLTEIVTAFRAARLEHEPGAEVTPSNSNYVLLGAIVEKASGRPYEQFVAEQILEPLKMEQTEFGISEHQQAIGMQFDEREHLARVNGVQPAAFGPAGGYISTAHDLFRFNRALATQALLVETDRDRMMGRGDTELGYAWVTQSHAGREISGWPGLIDGLNCSVMHSVDDETVVIVLANTEVVSAGRVATDIMAMIDGSEAPTYDEHREIPVPLVEQVQAVGHYVVSRKTERMIEAVDPEGLDRLAEIDVVLAGDSLVLDIADHGKKRMHPMGKGKFFFKDLPRTTAEYSTRSDGSGRLSLQQPNGTALVFLRKGPAAKLASR